MKDWIAGQLSERIKVSTELSLLILRRITPMYERSLEY